MQQIEEQIGRGDSHGHRWGVILAGGDGMRLLPLTRKVAGDDRPKQFCAVIGNETLLSQTQRRISRLIPQRRTLLVLTRMHAPFYADHVDGMLSSQLVIQPSNRGTAPAILYSLMRLFEMDPQGIVAVFPSDHCFIDEVRFVGHLDSAYAAAASQPQGIVLLGVPPESPEVEYGWIEPGVPVENPGKTSLFAISRFWEKPHHTLAAALMARGCLWNTFIMVGRIGAFLDLIRQTIPDLLGAFEAIRPSLLTVCERTAAQDLYSALRVTNFSQDALSMAPAALSVLCAEGLGWSDLGEISRVLSVLERHGREANGAFESGERTTGGGPRGSSRQVLGSNSVDTWR